MVIGYKEHEDMEVQHMLSNDWRIQNSTTMEFLTFAKLG
jgi:hypothetical protein